MKLNNITTKLLAVSLLALISLNSCKDQLDVKNPNSPTFGGNVIDEPGMRLMPKGEFIGMALIMVTVGWEIVFSLCPGVIMN